MAPRDRGPVDCTSCGRENRDDARFCAACGDPLVRSCASCDRDLAPDARFCDGCGSPVAGSGPSLPAAPAAHDVPPVDPTVAVRKTVTALFCDLVGSTTFAEKVDPESAREAMARYHAMAQATIEGHAGTVAKFIGDGVMALFGVPEVAEDDAERAVATGLDLQRGFEAIQAHIADRHGVDLGLRVGVNTGVVVIAEHDADIVGDALNTAARLEAACEPGEVLVGESTWRLARATAKFEPLGPVEARGKAEPVATFRVVAEQGEADEMATPFVGRDREVGQLRRAFDDGVAAGEARFVTVIGSPGVGKTRLAAEVVRDLGDTARAFDLRCERAGTATFAPVADLLRTVADIDEAVSPEEIAERIGARVSEADDADRLTELLGGFVGASPARSTEEMFFAVRRLVEILGAEQPVVLVVDDIQWAEPLFLDLLEHLAEWVRAAPALIVGLARPEIREVRPALAEAGRRVTEVVSLEGLDSAATEELAAELMGGRRLPADLTARLPTSTEGNPLFVRELMRMLVDDGVLVDDGDAWGLAIDAEAIEVPPTINSLLATRVERMSDADRRVLELASVVGSEFPRGAVGAVAEGIGAAELDATLERLRRREMVEPTGSYWGDEPVYRFHHVLIRDAAYRRLLKGARAELHVAVGEWTEATAADLVGEHEVTIGYHFEQAHDYRRQLDLHDDDTVALGRRAAALLRAAAERALERDDLAAAGALVSRAVACLADDDPSLSGLLLVGCESLLGTGSVAAGGPLVDRLTAVAAGDDRLTAWADCYGAELRVLADPDGLVDAERAANGAADRLEALDDQSGVAKARLVRAQALARLGRVGDCEAELDEALGAARSAGDDRRVTAVLGSAPVAALWGPSPVPRAGGRCLDVIRLLRITTGSPAVEAVSVRCQAVLEALRGRHDTARTMLDQARGTLEELGLRQGLLETELYAGIVELLAGDPVAAEPHLRDAHDGLGQLGIGADVGQAAAHLARSLLEQGRLEEAAELAEESEALAGQNPQTLIAARSVRAEILAASGSVDEALVLADDAVALASGSDILVDHANAVAAQARVRAAAGDTTGAATATAMAADLYEQKGAIVDLGSPAASAANNAADVSVAAAPVAADEPRNRADRFARDSLRAQLTGDRAVYAAGITDDAVVDDRRWAMTSTVVSGKEQVLDVWLDGVDTATTASAGIESVETLEVRGDDLVLHRVRIRVGGELEFLMVTRTTEAGLSDLAVLFDPLELDAAIAELDRLDAETATDAWWNGAHQRTFDSLSRYVAADADAEGWAAQLADDVAFDDRRSLVQSTTEGKPAVVEGWIETMDIGSKHPGDLDSYEPVAVRGDGLVLFSSTMSWRRGNATTSILGINQWTPDGRLDRIVFFDPDDLAAAAAELDRLHALADPLDAARDVWITENMAGQTQGDVDRVLRVAHPAFEIQDHRAIGWPSGGVEVLLDRSRAVGESSQELSYVLVRALFDAPGARAFALSYRAVADDGVVTEDAYAFATVLDPATGLILRSENFDGIDADAVVVRARELAATTRSWLATTAVQVGGAVNIAARAGRDDLLDGLVASAIRDDIAASGFGVVDREVVAVRGELLALVDAAFPDGSRRFQVEEIDEDDRLVAVRQFPADGLVDAFDRLDERWLELDESLSEAVHTGLELSRQARLGDADGVAALLADDFVALDHRPGGFGRLDGSSFVALTATTDDNPLLLFAPVIHRTADRGWVAVADMIPLDRSSSFEPVSSLTVAETRDGKVARLEFFYDDDFDIALARFDELTSDRTIAERTNARLQERLREGDIDGVMALMSPDLEIDDRRSGLRADFAQRDIGDLLGWMTETGFIGADDGSFEPSRARATVGARHGAAADSYVTPDGFRMDFFAAARFDVDGLLVKQIQVDTEAEALAALDELVAEEARSPDLVNTMTMLFEREDGDADPRVLAVRGDLVAMVVRRREDGGRELALGTADPAGRVASIETFGLDAFVAALDRLDELWSEEAPELVGTDVLLEFGAAVRYADLDGLARVLDDDMVGVSGLPVWVESFTKAQFLEYFVATAELPSTHFTAKIHAIADGHCVLSGGSVEGVGTDAEVDTAYVNHVVVRDGKVVRLDQRPPEDLDAALAAFDDLTHESLQPRSLAATIFDRFTASGFAAEFLMPGLVVDDRRRLARTSDGGEVGARLLASLDLMSSEVIATRGARLVAWRLEFRTPEDFEVEWYGASEVDLDGRFVRSCNVDTADEALAALDEFDRDEMRSPDLVNTMTMRFERTPGFEDAQVLAVRDDRFALVSRPGVVVPEYVVGVAGYAGDVDRLESFDDLAVGLDRIDDLATRRIARSGPRHLVGLSGDELDDALRALRDLHAEDFRLRSHRRLGSPDLDRDGMIEFWRASGELGLISVLLKVHAVAPGMAVFSATTRADDGSTIPIVALRRETDDGRVAASDTWDLADLPLALSRFDDLAEGDGLTLAERANARVFAALSSADIDEVGAVLSPDLHVDGRRRGLQAEYDRDAVIEHSVFFADEQFVGEAAEQEIEVLATVGARHLAASVVNATDDYELNWFVASRYDLDGRLVKSISVDTEADALAALEELVAEEDRSPDLANTMTMLFAHAAGGGDLTVLAVRGDLLALVERLTDGGSELVIGVASVAGETEATEVFAADELAAAVDRLNELWLNGEVAGVAGMDVIFEWGAAIRANDPVRLDRVLGDDLAGESNAHLSVKDFTKQGFLDDFAATDDVPGTVVTKKVHAIGDHHCVVTAANYVWDAAGEWREVSMVNHNVERDGRLIRFDQWAPDDLQAALARFDELATLDDRRTLAEAASAQLFEHMLAGDLESFAEMLAPGVETEDRRAGIASTMDRAALLEATQWMVDQGMIGGEHDSSRDETLAVAGARHLAIRRLYSTPGGFSIEVFSAVRHDLDGRVVKAITVETEAEARAALDELVAEEDRSPALVNTMTMRFERMDGFADAEVLSVTDDLIATIERTNERGEREIVVGSASPHAEIISLDAFPADQLDAATERGLELAAPLFGPGAGVWLAYGAALAAADVDAVARAVHDDLRIRNAQTFFPEVDDKQGMLDYLTGSIATLGATYARKVFAETDDLILMRVAHDVRSDDGASVVSDLLVLMGARDDKLALLEEWNLEDLAAALARFDELVAEAAHPNLAARTSAAIDEMLEAGDARGWAAAITDGYRTDDRRHGVRAEFAADDLLSAVPLARGGRVRRRVLATWGARWVAENVTFVQPDGFESDVHRVTRVDLDGRRELVVVVDTEEEALAALDELKSADLRSPDLVNTMTMLFERAAGDGDLTVLAVRGDLLALVERRIEDGSELVIGLASVAGGIDATEVFEVADLVAAADRLDRLYVDRGEANDASIGLIVEWGVAIRANDPVGLDRVLDDELTGESNARLSVKDFTKQGFLEDFAATADVAGTVISRKFHAVDDHHNVITASNYAHAGPGVWLEVSMANLHVVRDGRLVRFDQWDLDDLPAALARFDELTSSTPTLAERVTGRADELLGRGDIDGFTAMLPDDHRVEDRRPLMVSEYDRDLAVANAPSLRRATSELIATRGARLIARWVQVDNEGFTNDYVNVCRVTLDGMIERVVIVEREAEASAVLDELEAEELRIPDLVNTATMLLERTEGYADLEVLAVVGDLVALVRSATGGFEVVEATPAATVASRMKFTSDELGAALDRLDELREHHEWPPTPAAATGIATAVRIGTASLDRMDELLTDDFVLVQNGSLSVDIPDKDGMLALVRASVDLSIGVLTQKRFAVTESLTVGLIVNVFRGPDGAESIIPYVGITSERDGRIDRMESWDSDDFALALARFDELAEAAGRPTMNLAAETIRTVVRSGRVDFTGVLADDFTIDDRRRGVRVSYTSDETPDVAAGIEAFEVRSHEIVATHGARLAAWRVLLSVPGDYEIEWHGASGVDLDGRVVHTISTDTEAEVLAALDELVAEEDRSPDLVNTVTMLFERMDDQPPMRVVSVRGDLVAVVQRTGPELAGGPREFALGIATPGGEVESIEECGFDGLGRILDRSARLDPNLARLDHPDAFITAEVAQRPVPDAARMAETLAADFVFRGHRQLGTPDLDRAGLIDYFRATGDEYGLYVISKIHAAGANALVATQETLLPAADGSLTSVVAAVLVVERGGLIAEMHSWDPEDLPLALARFDRLVASDPDESQFDRAVRINRAIRVMGQTAHLQSSGRYDRFGEVMEDDVSFEDRRSTVSFGTVEGLGAVVDHVRSTAESGLRRPERPVILAVRGEDHVMIRTALADGEGNRIEQLMVQSLGPNGRLGRAVIFDSHDLAGAQEELHRVWAESLDEERAHQVVRTIEWTTAFMDGDHATIEGMLADDFVHRDFRPLGLGELDRETFLELVASVPEVRSGGDWIIPEVWLFDGVGVATYRLFQESADGFRSTEEAVALFAGTGDRASYMATYPTEDLETVLAVAEDMARSNGGPATARELAAQLEELIETDQLARLDEVLDDGVTLEDRRSVVSARTRSGPDAVREIVVAGRDGGLRHEGSSEVAARGDDHLLRATALVGDNDQRIARLVLLTRGPSGKIARRVEFDPDDLDAAFEELDTAYLASVSEVEAHRFEQQRRGGRAIAEGDAATVEQLLAPGCVSTDHRLLSRGAVDRAGFVALVAARLDTLGPGRVRLIDFRLVHPDVVLYAYEMRTVSPEHGVEAVDVAVAVNLWDGDVALRQDIFGEDQLDEAAMLAAELAEVAGGSIN